MRVLRRAALAAVAVSLLGAGSASAWAPASTATIHPGVNTTTAGSSCTANFIYQQGTTVYIGQAAHCSGTDGNTATNGCSAGTLPEGTQVQVDGASHPGVMVYNSWAEMQKRGETDPDTCQYNDLALVQLDPADVANVNPSVPFWGGPTGLASSTSSGQKVLSYGNSILRAGISALSPKEGYSLGTTNGGWTQTVLTVTPGIPGDSGSGFLTGGGQAFGVLSTIALAPIPASNGVGTLAKELAYAHTVAGFSGVTLVNGTEPFRGPLLPL
jgi:hypothetical protein